MSENAVTTTTTSTAARGANKAARTIIETVQNAGDHTFPSVVETAEVAMAFDVPTKVVLNQRAIVIVTAVTAAGAGAGILWGVNKLREIQRKKKIAKEAEELLTVTTPDVAQA